MNINEYTWSYWLACTSWTLDEAAFILIGVIPAKFIVDHTWGHRGREEEVDTEFLELKYLLEKRFDGSNKINPAVCLSWALSNNLTLNEELNNFASDFQAGPTDSVEVGQKRGSHFFEKRSRIKDIALSILNKPPPDILRSSLFKEKDGSIHQTNLADAIHNYILISAKKNDSIYGYSLKNIKETLSDAIKLNAHD